MERGLFNRLACQREFPTLQPNQMPTSPPMPLQASPEIERKPEPQRLGMNPATVDPTSIPSQTSFFVFILLSCRI